MVRIFKLLLLCSLFSFIKPQNHLPKDFVYVKQEIPTVLLDIRYAGTNNFVGKPINGYEKPTAILTQQATEALKKVQEKLTTKGYCLKIFDAYRPQRAVDHFVKWAKDENDTLQKAIFYPNVDKRNLFQLDYIAAQSGHSRGSTIDLTIVDSNDQELDMGGNYDFFGKISHQNASGITEIQRENRQLLKNVMSKHGFTPYYKEWWHFTYEPEPYPNTYFDFVVK